MFEPLLAAALFVGLVYFLGPWWSVYQFNTDEGLNLAKAALVAEGFELYKDIWSDQPPLMSILLAALDRIFPGSVTAARLSVLGFAVLLIASLFVLVRKYDGRFVAWISVLMLTSSQIFIKLSVSVLIGLPAISLAILAMTVIPKKVASRKYLLLCLSGVIFGMSLQIKMLTFIMFPVIAMLAYQTARDCSEPGHKKQGIVYLSLVISSTVISYVIIAVLSGALAFDQLYGIHTQAREAGSFSQRGGIAVVYRIMRGSEFPLVVLGAIGVFISLIRIERHNIILIVWVAITIVALSLHRPLWKHQVLLLIVPLSWVAGIGIGRFVEIIRSLNISRSLSGGIVPTVLIGLIVMLSTTNLNDARSRFTVGSSSSVALERLKWFNYGNSWVFTDMPIDVYRAGLFSPPPIAVVSEKKN